MHGDRLRWQHDAIEVAHRVFQGLLQRVAWFSVVLGDELTMDMAGADAHLQHDGGIGGLGQLEPVLDGLDDGFKVRPRIEQPHL